ncbi:hypothetical protein HKX48_008202 [Thoreauomyces humboldtii]|nr:hypothetical protein HKX48_008202 [Thoreauomyces humboldtii]
MVFLRSSLVILALTALSTVQAGSIDNLEARAKPQPKAISDQQTRINFMSQVLGRNATASDVANLNSNAISKVIKTQSQPPSLQVPVSSLDPPATKVDRIRQDGTRVAVTGTPLLEMELYQSYAAAAYCLNGLATWTCAERCVGSTTGTVVVSQFDDSSATDTVGYVAYEASTKNIIVAYRGSEGIRDWITNLQFAKADVSPTYASLGVPSGAQVHSGFQKAMLAAQPAVHAGLQTVFAAVPDARSDYTLTIVGHSLGGAVAILSAVDLYSLLGPSWSDRISVYTFGEPRVGNPIFANWIHTLPFSGQINRITHTTDMVPHLPPTSFGFLHHREEYWIDSTGTVNTCNDVNGEASACADSTFIPTIPAHLTGYFSIPFGPWC